MFLSFMNYFAIQCFPDTYNLVREGPNIAKYGPHFWLLSPQEAPKWVQDPGNGPQMIPPTAPD